MALHDTLQRLMDEQSENPNSLSKKSGVPQPTIFRILRGTSADPRRKNVEKLAKALNVSVDVLYGTQQGSKIGVNEPTKTVLYTVKPVSTNQPADELALLHGYRDASVEIRELLLDIARKAIEKKQVFSGRNETK